MLTILIFFIREVLGAEPDDWQADVLDMVAGAGKYDSQKRRISCVSGHGVGKSCCASWVLLWHMIFRFPPEEYSHSSFSFSAP